MKNYYQYKNDFKLPKAIYRKTVHTIKAYNYYKARANSLENSSYCKNVDKVATDKATAERYIASIENGLKGFVADEYQEPVFLHITENIRYAELEYIYGISEATLKRWVQRFIYGVAEEMGDNFKK